MAGYFIWMISHFSKGTGGLWASGTGLWKKSMGVLAWGKHFPAWIRSLTPLKSPFVFLPQGHSWVQNVPKSLTSPTNRPQGGPTARGYRAFALAILSTKAVRVEEALLVHEAIWIHSEMMVVYLKIFLALAGVAQWIERQPANQRVPSSIPSQGTYLGCRPGPQ